MAYEIIDDYLTSEQLAALQSTLLGVDFPWYYNYEIVHDGNDELSSYQFVHSIYRDHSWTSQFSSVVLPVMQKIDPTAIIRIKANLNPWTGEHVYGGWHNDYKFACKTAVFYVNDNNGWTEFENGERVESKANRLVVFDSDMVHSGVSATDVKARCLININYLKVGD